MSNLVSVAAESLEEDWAVSLTKARVGDSAETQKSCMTFSYIVKLKDKHNTALPRLQALRLRSDSAKNINIEKMKISFFINTVRLDK
jgi:hypothetical protein